MITGRTSSGPRSKASTHGALLVCAVLLGALLTGCAGTAAAQSGGVAAGSESRNPSAEPVKLQVGAAAAVQDLLEETAAAFEAEHGCEIVFNFSNMGVLQAQVENGSETDVFVSTSLKNMNALIDGGYISAETTATFAGDELAILVAKGNAVGITGPEDLDKVDIITTGDPASTAQGAKTREWLANLGMWEALEPKFMFARDALQICSYISAGDVEAGVGFASMVVVDPSLEVAYKVPSDKIKPIKYVAAPVLDCAQRELAAAYVEYLQSESFRDAVMAQGLTVSTK